MKLITAERISQDCECRLIGDAEVLIRDALPLNEATDDCVTFLSSQSNIRQNLKCPAAAVITTAELYEVAKDALHPAAWLICAQPQNAFMSVLAQLKPRRHTVYAGISPHSCLAEDVQLGADCGIAAHVTIAAGVKVGDRVQVHPGVQIGAGCVIGDDVVLHPNVVLYDGVVLGNRVEIHANSVIGADGFGYRVVDGRHQRIPHFGTVSIEDDVEIGACTTIDRSLAGVTVIGEGTKIDNLVMVGHNCRLGHHNILVSQVGFAGSVTTGDYVTCAGQTGIGDHCHLGDHSTYAAKSGVHKDMPGHLSYFGAPAEPEAEALRSLMSLKRLPQMRRSIKQLEAQVRELLRSLPENPDATSPHAA